jgi:type IV secretion system protein TrbJ
MKNNLRPSSFYRVVALNLAVVAVALTPIRLRAQMVVYDPSNCAQNVLTTARSLQQLNTQFSMLANQVKGEPGSPPIKAAVFITAEH